MIAKSMEDLEKVRDMTPGEVFPLWMVIEKMLRKGKKVYVYDIIDWTAMWDVLKVYNVD